MTGNTSSTMGGKLKPAAVNNEPTTIQNAGFRAMALSLSFGFMVDLRVMPGIKKAHGGGAVSLGGRWVARDKMAGPQHLGCCLAKPTGPRNDNPRVISFETRGGGHIWSADNYSNIHNIADCLAQRKDVLYLASTRSG